MGEAISTRLCRDSTRITTRPQPRRVRPGERREDAMAARKRWSLSVPQDGFTLAEHAALAREAEQWGYTDAWSFESDGLDCFSPLTVIAAAPPSPTSTRAPPPRWPSARRASRMWRRAASSWAWARAPR